LAYADDIVLLAEDEEGMRSTIGRLEGYMEKKRLELNVNKTKIRFWKEGGKSWNKRWKGIKIEEVKEFTYLGYRLQKNGGQEVQWREIEKKVKKALKVVGERQSDKGRRRG